MPSFEVRSETVPAPDKLAALARAMEQQGLILEGAPKYEDLWLEHLQKVWPTIGRQYLPIEVWQHASARVGIHAKGSATVYSHIIRHVTTEFPESISRRDDACLPIPPYNYPIPKRGLGMGLAQRPDVQFIKKYGPSSTVTRLAGATALQQLIADGDNVLHLNINRAKRPPISEVLDVISDGFAV